MSTINTRFVVLPDSRKLLLGVDLSELFMPGVVYEAEAILGEIIIRPLGKTSAVNPGYGHITTDANQIINAGRHLVTMAEAIEATNPHQP